LPKRRDSDDVGQVLGERSTVCFGHQTLWLTSRCWHQPTAVQKAFLSLRK